MNYQTLRIHKEIQGFINQVTIFQKLTKSKSKLKIQQHREMECYA